MKIHRLIFTLLTCILATIFVKAQETTPHPTPAPLNTFYFEPLYFAISTFEIGYEKDFKNRTKGISLSAGILLREDSPRFNQDFGEQFMQGVNVQLGYKVYVVNNVEQGGRHERLTSFYFSPFIKYNYTSNSYDFTQWVPDSIGFWETISIIDEISSVSGGVILGVRLIVVDRMAFDFYFGGGVKLSQISQNPDYYTGGILSVGYTGILPRVGMKFGFLF